MSTKDRQDSFAFASIGIQVALWVLMILFAFMDRRKLISYGYLRPARVWWILLVPPLVYLIMRGVEIDRQRSAAERRGDEHVEPFEQSLDRPEQPGSRRAGSIPLPAPVLA